MFIGNLGLASLLLGMSIITFVQILNWYAYDGQGSWRDVVHDHKVLYPIGVILMLIGFVFLVVDILA